MKANIRLLLFIFTSGIMIMQSCENPAFAEEERENRHATTVGTAPETARIPVGDAMDAWLENDRLPEELRQRGDIHYCEADNDYFTMKIDGGVPMPYRLAAHIEGLAEDKTPTLPPGNHSLELEHCINYCLHGTDEYGSPDKCLGNNQYFLYGSRNIAVVEVERLLGPNSFSVQKKSIGELLSLPPHVAIDKTLSLPLGRDGEAVVFRAEPYPKGQWPEKCPEWRFFGGEFKIGETRDTVSVATDNPFRDTLTVACGSISRISIGLAVVAVDRLVAGTVVSGTPTDIFEEAIAKLSPKRQNAACEEAIAERHEADWDESFEICSEDNGARPYGLEGDKYHVVNVQTKEIAVKAIPLPDVADASSSEIASYSEALLPDAWQFSCNGKASDSSRLLISTDISEGGEFIYEATSGASKKRLTIHSSGVSILSPSNTANGSASRPEAILVPVPEQEGKYAFDGNLLVPVILHPIHLKALENLPVSLLGEEEYWQENALRLVTPTIYNYGELNVKCSGKVRLWHDRERKRPCGENDTFPLDKDSVVFAEGLVHTAESGCDSARIHVEYSSLIFNCNDEMPVAVLDLRPSSPFQFLLLNNDNDDMGGKDAAVPKDTVMDMAQSYVEEEDDLRPISFKCPILPPSLSMASPPEIMLQAYPEDSQSFEIWSHFTKARNISYYAHVFDTEGLATEEGQSGRFYSVYAEGCEATGASGGNVVARWTVNGQPFIYRIPFTVLNMQMGVDDGKCKIGDESHPINLFDFGSEKEGDFGSCRCVFWVNDDSDCIHWEFDRFGSQGWHEDDFGTAINCLDDTIGARLLPSNGISRFTDIWNYSINDLEDFNRLHIVIDSTFGELAQSGDFGDFEFTLANAPINIFKAENESLDYLKTVAIANKQAKQRRLLALTPTTELPIPNKCLNANGKVSPFIWEGCAAGTYDLELSVSMKPKDGRPGEFIGKRRVRLVLRDISSYFDVFNATENGGTIVKRHKFTDGKPQTDDYILFVHGFNVTPDEKRLWPATIHKRLWWSGFRGRTGIFTWDCITVNVKKDLKNGDLALSVYDQSELKAWKQGAKLKDVIVNLVRCYGTGNNGKVSVLAHSQGNIVTGEALRLLPPSSAIDTYIATQAAISSSCFQHIDTPYFLEKEYRKKKKLLIAWLVTPDVRAHYPGWNELSPQKQPPFLQSLAIDKKAMKMANYYNPEDWALSSASETSWEDNNLMRPNIGYGYKGDKRSYDVRSQYRNNFFFKGHRAIAGTVLKFPPPSDEYRRQDIEDTHAIFSLAAQAWGRPIGVHDKTRCFDTHFNLKEIDYKDNHYSHSKQFRSNIQTELKYWDRVHADCK